MANEDNDSEFSKQLREQSDIKMAKRSGGGSDEDGNELWQSQSDNCCGLNDSSDETTSTADVNAILHSVAKKFKPNDDKDQDDLTNSPNNTDEKQDIGGGGDFIQSPKESKETLTSNVLQSGNEICDYLAKQNPDEKTDLHELKIDIPQEKDIGDGASGSKTITSPNSSEKSPLQDYSSNIYGQQSSSQSPKGGLLMASSNLMIPEKPSTEIAPVYEDISDDAKESSDSGDSSEQNYTDQQETPLYNTPVSTIDHEEYEVNAPNLNIDEDASIASPSEESNESDLEAPEQDDNSESSESQPSANRDDESIPLYTGSEICITKTQLRRIYIPNAAIYTSRLSDLIFGKEVLEEVAISDEENKLVLLDRVKLRAILTHVVQVFTTQGVQMDDELVLHFLDHKLSNLATNLKAAASQPN